MTKRWLVFLETGVSVELDDDVDPSTPEGLRALKDEAADRFSEALINDWFSIRHERDEEEGYY